MIMKIGTITRRKISALLVTAVMVFSLLPDGLPAAEDGGATLIPTGDYTISSDGAYRLDNGYSGIITIAPGAYGVTVIGSADGKNHPNTGIIVAERPLPLQLIIQDLKLTAPEGKSGIDFGNALGVSYEKWPYNLNNAGQPAPYSLADVLLIGGDCSVTGGKGRAGVYVGDEVCLTIDKAPGKTDVQASLAAAGGEKGAGIGGDRGFSGGSVTINGGTITATGGTQGAGLGGLVGAITVNGGTVTATGGQSTPGLGNSRSFFIITDYVAQKYNLNPEKTMSTKSFVIPGETIIINGGTVTAAGNSEAGISALGGIESYQYASGMNMISNMRKYSLGRLTVNGGSVTASGSSETDLQPGISGRWIEINGGVVSAYSSNGQGISGVTTTINGGTVLASGGSSPNEFQKFINDGLGQLGDMMNSSENTEIPEEASAAFEALDDMFRSMADILTGGLFGPGGGGAGIGLYPDDSLTINDGIVIARGGTSSAGIGGSVMGGLAGMFAGSMNIDFTPGTITIKGGLVSATGGSGGAGIGGGYKQRAEGITISGNPTVIATRGSDGAQDIGSGEGGPETFLRDHLGKALSYIRLEVKDKTTGQPLSDKKVTVDGKTYFTNKDGLLGFFAPRTTGARSGAKGSSSSTPTKIIVSALASSAFPGAVTEIIPSEQNIRSAIDLDFYLQNISLLGISKDSADGVPLRLTPVFDPQLANYALEVDNMVTSLRVIPERVAGNAVTAVQVNGSQVQYGEAALVPLQIGENNILVTVALPSDEWAADAAPLKKAYLFKVTRTNIRNLPSLMLLESNQPLDEGSVFRARYAFKLPVTVGVAPVKSAREDNTMPAPSLADSTWPGIWTGTWRGTVDYGDGSGLQDIVLREDGSFDLEHRYGVGGDYPVKIALTYEDSGLVTGSLNVKVNYVAPQLLGADIAGEPFDEGGVRIDKNIDINEGDLLVLQGSVSDPGDNRWTVTLDSNDSLGLLGVPLRTDKTFTVEKTLYDPAPVSSGKGRSYKPAFHYLDFLVQDDTGLTGARRLKVNVKNVTPSVLAHGTPLAQRGLAFSGGGSFSDPGRDEWQASVDYGDGSGPQALSLNTDKTFALNHIYQQTGSFTVTVRVEDEDGGVGTTSFPVKVKDYLFALEAGADTTVNEGEALIRNVPVRGPAAKVQSTAVDYGDGSAVETLSLESVNQSGKENKAEHIIQELNQYLESMLMSRMKMLEQELNIMRKIGMNKAVEKINQELIRYMGLMSGRGEGAVQINLNHTYADNGKYTVTLKLTDTDGDVHEGSFRVEAANAAPEVRLENLNDCLVNETFTCSGSFTDLGEDTWNATIDFGDGSGAKGLKLNDDKTFSVSHSYNSQGSYTITVTVSDDDEGIGQATQQVMARRKGASSDADLYSLNIGAPLDSPFDRNVTEYIVTGPAGATFLTVTAHPKATIRYRITPNPVFSDILPDTLTDIEISDAELIIKVTAENGNTKTYTIDNTED